ncbi:hypothetical protein Vretimale_7396 [Volvox reticuliferus]|uniref:Uncharacterized protein n=1 Tax=Volvox reticuliferus TaxID=1737510 RepID=A0A8J4G989_9CHLO|nr:hypothetical protein Vretimale_7396 [Volvox reticuliferus]
MSCNPAVMPWSRLFESIRRLCSLRVAACDLPKGGARGAPYPPDAPGWESRGCCGPQAEASVFRTPSAGFSARARRRANAGTCFAPANDAPDMLKPCACLLPPARPAPETLFGCCWCCCDCIGGCLYKAEMLGGPAAAIAKVGAAKAGASISTCGRIRKRPSPILTPPVSRSLVLL